MDQILNLFVTFITSHASSALGVAVPVGVGICLVYLVGNDILDGALEEKKDKGKATAAQLFNAVLNDVTQKNAVAAAVTAAVAAAVAGGDLKAQVASAIFAVAAANAANFEASTKAKLAALLAP